MAIHRSAKPIEPLPAVTGPGGAMATKQTRSGTSRRVTSGLMWLYPGMRVKRWLALIPIGLLPAILGVAILAQRQAPDYFDHLDEWAVSAFRQHLDNPAVYLPLSAALILIGLLVILAAAIGMIRAIVSVVAPEDLPELSEVVHRKRALSQGAKIVVIGGGTGLSTLLRGLKRYTANLTAVVTMTDDGGSSGLLQRQMLGGVLPPGDIRNCLVALADAEPLMADLFQYRFETQNTEDGLSGHSFGNLFITAMAQITGDFERAVEETSNILNIRGRVLPSTVESVLLVGQMADGREVVGESNIAHDPAAITRIMLCPDAPHPLPEVLESIRQADIIVMGPGSVFTSVVPNLLVTEITEAVAASKAMKAYVCNVMTQKGETDGFSASDHVRAIEEHAGRRVFEYVLVNTARPSADLLKRYTHAGSDFVTPDLEVLVAMGYKAVKGSYISESAVVRHDPDKLASKLLKLYAERPLWNK